MFNNFSATPNDCAAIKSAADALGTIANIYAISMQSTVSDPSTYLACALKNRGYLIEADANVNLTGQIAEPKLRYAIAQGLWPVGVLNNHRSEISEYQNFVDSLDYFLPIPLDEKMVDIVFVIDRSYFVDNSIDTVGFDFLTIIN